MSYLCFSAIICVYLSQKYLLITENQCDQC